MNADQLRQTLEAHMPPPAGIRWDGDHYVADKDIPVSFRNATTWQDMLRGFKLAAEVLNNKAS